MGRPVRRGLAPALLLLCAAPAAGKFCHMLFSLADTSGIEWGLVEDVEELLANPKTRDANYLLHIFMDRTKGADQETGQNTYQLGDASKDPVPTGNTLYDKQGVAVTKELTGAVRMEMDKVDNKMKIATDPDANGKYAEVNMDDPTVLQNFVKTAIMRCQAAAGGDALSYMLLLSSHGAGYGGYGGDLDKGTRRRARQLSGMTNAQIATAIQNAMAAPDAPATAVAKLDAIGFDACLMASYSALAAYTPLTTYFLASESTVPGHGLNYAAFSSDKANIYDMLTNVVDEFVKEQPNGNGMQKPKTMTIFKSSAFPAFDAAMKDLFGKLATALDNGDHKLSTMIGRVRKGVTAFIGYPDQKEKSAVDLGAFLQRFEGVCKPAAGSALAQSLSAARSAYSGQLASVVQYHKNGPTTQQSATGMHIMFPNKKLFASDWEPMMIEADYLTKSTALTDSVNKFRAAYYKFAKKSPEPASVCGSGKPSTAAVATANSRPSECAKWTVKYTRSDGRQCRKVCAKGTEVACGNGCQPPAAACTKAAGCACNALTDMPPPPPAPVGGTPSPPAWAEDDGGFLLLNPTATASMGGAPYHLQSELSENCAEVFVEVGGFLDRDWLAAAGVRWRRGSALGAPRRRRLPRRFGIAGDRPGARRRRRRAAELQQEYEYDYSEAADHDSDTGEGDYLIQFFVDLATDVTDTRVSASWRGAAFYMTQTLGTGEELNYPLHLYEVDAGVGAFETPVIYFPPGVEPTSENGFWKEDGGEYGLIAVTIDPATQEQADWLTLYIEDDDGSIHEVPASRGGKYLPLVFFEGGGKYAEGYEELVGSAAGSDMKPLEWDKDNQATLGSMSCADEAFTERYEQVEVAFLADPDPPDPQFYGDEFYITIDPYTCAVNNGDGLLRKVMPGCSVAQKSCSAGQWCSQRTGATGAVADSGLCLSCASVQCPSTKAAHWGTCCTCSVQQQNCATGHFCSQDDGDAGHCTTCSTVSCPSQLADRSSCCPECSVTTQTCGADRFCENGYCKTCTNVQCPQTGDRAPCCAPATPCTPAAQNCAAGLFCHDDGNGAGHCRSCDEVTSCQAVANDRAPCCTVTQVQAPIFTCPSALEPLRRCSAFVLYTAPQEVRITSATPGASIYYTSDKTAPSRYSQRYDAALGTAPIVLTAGQVTTFRAVAVFGAAQSTASDAGCAANSGTGCLGMPLQVKADSVATVAPTCPPTGTMVTGAVGLEAVCCDADGSCNDGDDVWCCGGQILCSRQAPVTGPAPWPPAACSTTCSVSVQNCGAGRFCNHDAGDTGHCQSCDGVQCPSTMSDRSPCCPTYPSTSCYAVSAGAVAPSNGQFTAHGSATSEWVAKGAVAPAPGGTFCPSSTHHHPPPSTGYCPAPFQAFSSSCSAIANCMCCQGARCVECRDGYVCNNNGNVCQHHSEHGVEYSTWVSHSLSGGMYDNTCSNLIYPPTPPTPPSPPQDRERRCAALGACANCVATADQCIWLGLSCVATCPAQVASSCVRAGQCPAPVPVAPVPPVPAPPPPAVCGGGLRRLLRARVRKPLGQAFRRSHFVVAIANALSAAWRQRHGVGSPPVCVAALCPDTACPGNACDQTACWVGNAVPDARRAAAAQANTEVWHVDFDVNTPHAPGSQQETEARDAAQRELSIASATCAPGQVGCLMHSVGCAGCTVDLVSPITAESGYSRIVPESGVVLLTLPPTLDGAAEDEDDDDLPSWALALIICGAALAALLVCLVLFLLLAPDKDKKKEQKEAAPPPAEEHPQQNGSAPPPAESRAYSQQPAGDAGQQPAVYSPQQAHSRSPLAAQQPDAYHNHPQTDPTGGYTTTSDYRYDPTTDPSYSPSYGAPAFSPGDKVTALYLDGQWYDATVLGFNHAAGPGAPGGGYALEWYDGSYSDTVPPEQIRRLS